MPLLQWLAADQTRYAVASGLPLLALSILAVTGMGVRRADVRLSSRAGTATYLALAAVALLAARWPTLFVRDPLNQDEAQALAQAITALRDPLPWHAFDGNTCGPLNTYVLILPALFGVHLTFLTTRLVALALEFGAISSLYACAAMCFDAGIARIAAVPAVTFFTLATQDHFVHYSGEHLSIFLSMLTLALLCAGFRRGGLGWMFAGGLSAGMMPFAKLQSVPLAGMTVAAFSAIVVFERVRRPAHKALALGALAAGIVTGPALILLAALFAGTLEDFWISYIQTSLAYIQFDVQPASFLLGTPEFGPLFDVLLAGAAAGAACLALRYRFTLTRQRVAFAVAAVVLIGAVWSIYAPKRGSLNYLLFAILPAAGVAAAGLGVTAYALRLRRSGAARGALAFALVAAVLISERAFVRPPYPYLDSLADYRSGSADPVTTLIATHLRPGERLAIWGWRPQYFVSTYTLLGTRDAISQYQYDPDFNPYFTYFRKRYVHDFERNRPAGFLDAGADSFDFQRRGPDGFETFPELAAIVDRDYRLVGSAHGIRLFVRRGHG